VSGAFHSMTYKTIQLAYDGAVATITLNRPEKRNAISFDLIDDLLRALDEVAKSDSISRIVTGAGKAFCSGMDLDNLKSLLGRSAEQNLQDSQIMVQLFRSLYEFPKVTIAAVNGAAIAGGTGLALLCDFTLAVPEAKFGYTEVRIGFVPAIVSTFLLRQVGEKQARDLLHRRLRIDGDDVGVSHQQNRPLAAVPLDSRDEIGTIGVEREHPRSNPLAFEDPLQVVRRELLVAGGIARVQPKQRLEVLHGFVFERLPVGRARRLRQHRPHRDDGKRRDRGARREQGLRTRRSLR